MLGSFQKHRARREQRKSVSQTARGERRRSLPRRVARVVAIVLCAVLVCLPAALCATAAAYIPALSILLVLVASAIWLAVIRRSVTVEVEALAGGQVERGSTCTFVVRMRNASRLPAPRVEASCYVTDLFGGVDSTTVVAAALGPKGTAENIVDVRLPHLGSFSCGVSRAVAHDLVGAFSSEVPCEGAEAQVTVTPRAMDVGSPELDTSAADDSVVKFRPVLSDDMDYAGVREYRFGDPMKSVHWNLSSRDPRGELYTRLYEANVTPSLAIVLDGGAAPYDNDGLMSVLDGTVEASCALYEDSMKRGIDTGMAYETADGLQGAWRGGDGADLVGDVARPSSAAGAGVESLETLASVCMSNHGAGNVCWVSSRVPREAVELLMGLRMRRRHPMVLVVVPAGDDPENEKTREAALKDARSLSANGIAWRAVVSNEQETRLQGTSAR